MHLHLLPFTDLAFLLLLRPFRHVWRYYLRLPQQVLDPLLRDGGLVDIGAYTGLLSAAVYPLLLLL